MIEWKEPKNHIIISGSIWIKVGNLKHLCNKILVTQHHTLSETSGSARIRYKGDIIIGLDTLERQRNRCLANDALVRATSIYFFVTKQKDTIGLDTKLGTDLTKDW